MSRRVDGGRRSPAPSAVLGVVLLLGAVTVTATAQLGGSAPKAVAPDPKTTVNVVATPRPAGARERPSVRTAPVPARIEVPAAGIRAAVDPLGLEADGTLAVPRDPRRTGWWTGGARPGARGAAVVVGHVDSATGPAVFFGLRRLRSGDRIRVVGRDGTAVTFAVTRIARYAKDRFPTRRVYGPTRAPSLRLITCSGSFDRGTGHYLDNTVVYATAPSPRARG